MISETTKVLYKKNKQNEEWKVTYTPTNYLHSRRELSMSACNYHEH